MKKLISLLLVMLMVFALVACGAEKEPQTTEAPITTEAPTTEAPTTEATEAPTEAPTEDAAEAKVAQYVDTYGQSILDGITASAGDQVEASIRAEGCTMVIEMHLTAFENVDDSAKASMQAAYDAMDSTFEQLLAAVQTELPELESLTILVCDKNGDLLATVVTDGVISSTAPTSTSDDPIQQYVDVYGDYIIAGIESSLTGSGMTCTSTVEAIDGGIVVTICINELENVDEASKAELQAMYDANIGELQPVIESAKAGLPELQYITYKMCDKNGDLLATIHLS